MCVCVCVVFIKSSFRIFLVLFSQNETSQLYDKQTDQINLLQNQLLRLFSKNNPQNNSQIYKGIYINCNLIIQPALGVMKIMLVFLLC